jgi:hypothetical protein
MVVVMGGMPQTLLSDFRMHSIGQELKIFFCRTFGAAAQPKSALADRLLP